MTIEERLENLESELARSKRQTRWLLSGAALVLVVIALAGWGLSPSRALAQPTSGTVAEVRTRKLIVVDENGMRRAILAADDDGPWLDLYDETGVRRVGLHVPKVGPWLALYDETGQVRVSLNTFRREPSLYLFDETGTSRATLGVTRATTRDGTTITYPESSLLLYGPDGYVRWSAP